MDTNESSECSFKSGESQEKDIPSAPQEGAKKEVPPSMQKICLVCGDKALGYNFNVISCESCKAFFRRNALTTKEFKCPFTNNCEITVVTRRFCQKCRLVKCLAVGMVKEFIMSDEDKAEKRRKIEENRAKKRQSTEPDDGVSSSKSYKHESEPSTVGYPPPMQELSSVQYNMLNSTTCSPNSSVQSPLNPEMDNSISSINSPPIYSQYAPIHSSEIPYTMKLYPMDDKMLPNRTFIDQRLVEPYNMCDSMEGKTNSYSQSQNKVGVYLEPYNMCDSMEGNTNSDSQSQNKVRVYPIDYKTVLKRDLMEQRSSSEQYGISNNLDSNMNSMEGNTNSDSQSQNKVRVSPIDYKTVLNRDLMEQRSSEQYGISNNLDSNMNFESQKPHILNMKVYPMDQKSVTNKTLIEQRIEPFNVGDSMDSNMYSNSPKKIISIRSLLTNGNGSVYREPQHVCEEIPSTSTDPNVNKARDILQDVERIEPNSMESILCEAIKLEFEAFSSVNSCVGSSRELNEVERAKMNELIVANKALNAPIDDAMSQLIGDIKQGDGKHDPRLITIVNLTAVAIRRFIKMAKKINAFKNMCEEDQIALLKGGCIEMMILRSTMTYDGQKNQWKLPHNQEQFGSIRTDVLKLAKGNIYLTHESFIKSFDLRWRTDENIILVMSAILLFTPTRPQVVHRDVIKLEQNSYYYLLRRYLESIYPGCEAKSTFLKLIQKIMELRKLAEEITGVYLDVNPLEPLLMEIFDLKHHAA